MKIGMKSLIGGAHCAFLHPFFVGCGWTRRYGPPWDPRLWFAFALHDVGYALCDEMDGEIGEQHVVLGARIMGRLFGPRWESECYRHSRYWCRRMGLPISRLCLADKLAFALTPAWLYLPMAGWTGELTEYMERSRQRQAGDNSFTEAELIDINSGDSARWLRGLQAYTLRWVEQHETDAVDFDVLTMHNDATPSLPCELKIEIT